ncbi:MAG TPA: hypothetical protein VGF41_05930, partial [Myxococcaceae bacterium]
MHHLTRSLLAMATLLGGFVGAEEPASEPLRRQLGEHVFIPRLEVYNPFTSSDIASTSGFGYGTAGGPTFNLQGQPVNLADYQIVAYSQSFSGQWGIADWWAVRLIVNGTLYTGANGSAIAGIGVNGVVRGGAGTTLSWRVAPTFRLGLLLDVTFGPSIGISILEAIQNSIADDSVQTPVHTSSSTVITPTLSAAWSFARGWGLLVNASFIHSTVTANEDSVGANQLQIQGALDLDLKELGSIPMGFGLNFSGAYSTGEQTFRRYVYGLGIFYTGRKELTLGL